MAALFFVLLAKILPLYALMALGFFAGRTLKVQRESIALLLIYIISPVVFFGATAQMHVEKAFMFLPVGVFIIAVLLGLGFYYLADKAWAGGRKNLAGYMLGTANQGYFGIPVFLALFGEKNLGLYVVTGLGLTLYEATFGYYIMARGHYTVKESMQKVLKMPLLPCALAGIAFSAAGFSLPPAAKDFYATFKGAYTILGTMIIGLSLGKLHHLKSDLKFTGLIFAGKFLCWPLAALVFLQFYQAGIGPPPEIVRQCILLISVMPVAANAAAFATYFNLEPEKAASVVALSTVFALFYIPFVMGLAGF